jgi:MFS superfamily sulfate permease-like transporter
MPEAALSAVVFRIGFDLIDFEGMRRIFRQRRSEFWVALITLLTVVFVGVEQGIILAIVLSLIEHTRHGYRPKNMLVTPASSGIWRAQPLASGSQALPGLMVYRFTHSIYYANAQQFTEEIGDLVHQASPPLRWLCLDAAAIDDVDFTAAETLRALHSNLKKKGVRLVVAQVMDEMRKESHYGLQRLFGEDVFYDTLEDVAKNYRQQVLKET